MGGKANSNGFDKPENKHKAGRPRKNRLNELIQSELGEAATASQIMAVTNSLLNMSEAELYKITDCEDKNKYPFFVVVLATTLIKDRKRAAADTVFKLIERAAGRAPQNVELRVENMIKPDIEALSEAEKIQLLNMLSKIDTESKTD